MKTGLYVPGAPSVGSLGRRVLFLPSGSASGPSAPTLAMDASWDTTQTSPLFSILAAWLDQDDLQFEYRVVGAGSWTVSNHTVLFSEINGATIDFGVAALADGNYEARCKFKHAGGPYSDYSNTQAFTILAPVLPVKTFRDSRFSNASGSVTDFTAIDVGGGNCLLVVALAWQGTNGITSVVFDPAGENITLTQDVLRASGHSVAVYSAVIPAVSGTKTIRLTLVSAAFFSRGVSVWTVTGLNSNLKKQTAQTADATGNFLISVDNGDLMFGSLYNDPSGSTRTFATSTQAPDALHSSHGTNQFPDWAITSTNASFSVVPGSTGNVTVGVTYR